MTDLNEKELSILRLAHEEFTPGAAERARVRAALATTLGAAAATAAGSAAAAASGAAKASAAASGTGAAALGGAASTGAASLGAASAGATTLGGALGTTLLAVSAPKLVVVGLGAVAAGAFALQGPSNTASKVAEAPPSGRAPDASGPPRSGHALGPASAHEPPPRPEETRPTDVQERDEPAAQHTTRTAVRAEPIVVAPQTGAADLLLGGELTLLAQARRSLNQGDGATALQVLAQLNESYPKGTFIEERRATQVLALCTMGQVARGRAEMRSFATEYPQSVYADRIRSSCTTK